MAKLRIEAPKHMHAVDIAQAVIAPYQLLLKAEQIKYSERTFQRYKAMQEMADDFEKAYAKQLDKIKKVIEDYIEKKIILASLGKANGSYQPMFTPQQLAALQQIIVDYHLAFVITQVGPAYVPPEAVQRLIDIGILPQDLAYTYQPAPGELPPEARKVIADAYNYGKMMGGTPAMRPHAREMTAASFRRRREPPLSPQEKAARTWIQQHAAEEIKGLGNTVASDFTTIAIENDAELKARYQQAIREEIDINVARRDQWRKAASELGHKTGDWARGFKRIAATEKQKAMQEGFVGALIEKEGDPETIFVAKQPAPDACDDCVRLHLVAGPGSNPRIFKLSQLIANGSNIGRKRRDWKAVVGTVHPWCGCEIVHVPAGWEFDDEGNMVPKDLKRSDYLNYDLRKAQGNLTFKHVVPDKGCSIRVGDPVKVTLIQKVIDETPKEIFDKKVGVTLITVDHPRVQNPMDDHDLAYWTGNEIRLDIHLKPERLRLVLQHEIAHSLNVYLMYQWGGADPVRQWHKQLYRVSKREGFVSEYAKLLPIENAAEATRLYLYDRRKLMLSFPSTFAMLHTAYRGIWNGGASDGKDTH